MGRTVTVDDPRPLDDVIAAEPTWSIVMVDNALVLPRAPLPARWRDVRIKTPAGTIAVKREGARLHVVSFGNDDAMNALQDRVAALLRR